MAYMNQERKAKLVANLKKVMPAAWKYSVGVRNHSTIMLTIWSAPVDLIAEMAGEHSGNCARVNDHYPREAFRDPALGETFSKIVDALNDGNHDRSDMMTDYFDVGWYVDISIGRWDKPFICTAAKEVA